MIKTEELTHYYNSHAAVDHISFVVEKASIFGLLGPNGAGKSTTIKMLITLLPPSSGTAVINGLDIVKDAGRVREEIGYVPQLLSADGELTGYENLLLSAKLYGLCRKGREKRILEVLKFMGLDPFAHQLVKRYSGGMIRRLEIGQALIHEPSSLFLDEPTVGLDPTARRLVWKKINELRQEYGTTILLTTHDMDEADRLCDTVAFMYRGKIVKVDSPTKLKAAMGPKSTLDDVFMHYTGASIQEGGDYDQAKEIRNTISHLD